MKYTTTILLLLLIGSVPALAQTECPQTVQLIQRALPASVGNADAMRGLLAPKVSSQLSDLFNPASVTGFVGDELTADCCDPFNQGNPNYECTYGNTNGSALQVDLRNGEVFYANRTRSENKQPTSLTSDAAFEASRRAVTAFGVPESELSAPAFRYLRLTGVSNDERNPNAVSFRAEGHVWYQRAIGGVPVAFSKFHVALDARGDVARTQVVWPDFALAPGLDVGQMYTREEVLAEILDEVLSEARCGSLSDVVAGIVYASTSLLEDGGAAQETGGAYAPALLVTLIPVEQADDSGVPQMPVQNLVFPLLGTVDR